MTATTFTPTLPLTATANSVLSQGWISSDQVVVPVAAGQVATFCNAAKGGLAEAAVITASGPGGAGELQYLAQDPTQPGGWAPLQDLQENTSFPALEVVAAVNRGGGGAFGTNLFWNDGTNLMMTWVTGADAWQTPVPAAPGVALTGLSVTYTVAPSATDATVSVSSPPSPVVYGVNESGQLFMYPFTDDLGWVPIALTLEGADLLAAPMVLTCFESNGATMDWVLVSAGADGPAQWSGTMAFNSGGTTATSTVSGASDYPATLTPFGQVFGSITNPTTSPTQLMTGVLPMYLDSNQMPFITTPNTAGGVYLDGVVPAPYSSIDSTAVTIDSNGMTLLYLVDKSTESLAVMRQIGWTNNVTLPLWAPFMPIAPEAAFAYPSSYPLDPPTVFVAGSVAGALTLYQQDPTTAQWALVPIVFPTDQPPVEVSQYVTQISVSDADGSPVGGRELSLTASFATGVQIGNQSLVLGPSGVVWDPDPSTPTIVTSQSGTLTVTMLATDLAPPTLTVTDVVTETALLGGATAVAPGAAVQSYLGQSGTPAPGMPPTTPAGSQFPPSQPLTGATLSGATYSDPTTGATSPLFPGVQSSQANPVDPDQAAQGMQQVMAMPPPSSGADDPGADTARSPKAGGFIINRVHPGLPSFQAFETTEELHAALWSQTSQFSLFGDVGNFFGDVWQGIKTGAAKVAHLAVDLANDTVSLVVEIAGALVQVGEFIVATIEDACNVLLAIFSALLAAIEFVIAFLEALFDLGAIWRTKLTFQAAMKALPAHLETTIAAAQANVDKITAELADQVSSLFDGLAGHFQAQGDPSFNDSSATVGQQVGSPPSDQPLPVTPPATGSTVSASDVTSNPQGSWLQNQVSGASVTIDPPTDPGTLQGVWQTLNQDLGKDAAALQGQLNDVMHDLLGLIDASSASSFGDMLISDFLTTIGAVVVDLINLLGQVATLVLELMNLAVEGLDDFLNEALTGSGIINTIYGWMKGLAGYGSCNDPLTFAAFASLLLAFPYNIVYELMNGSEPFPGGGQYCDDGSDARAEFGTEFDATQPNLGCQLAGPVLQTVYVAVDWVSDAWSDAPGWLTAVEVAGPLLINTFSWPSTTGIPFQGFDGSSETAVGAWEVGYSYPLITLATFLARGQTAMSDDDFTFLGKMVLSLAGIIDIIYAGVAGVEAIENGGESALDVVAGIIGPFSNAFSFLTTTMFEGDTAELSLALKLVLDFVGDVVGGLLEIIAVD